MVPGKIKKEKIVSHIQSVSPSDQNGFFVSWPAIWVLVIRSPGHIPFGMKGVLVSGNDLLRFVLQTIFRF